MFNRNKRGVIGTTVTYVIATLVIFFILIVFFLLSSIPTLYKSISEKNEEVSLQVKNQASLLALLKTNFPVEVNGKQQNLSFEEIIRLGRLDNSYNLLAEEKSKILGGVYSNYNFDFVSSKIKEEYFIVPWSELIIVGLEVKK
jgi:predicted PurR-regulated permease PerM